ncbi:MAG: alpha/beta hydrolase-fold protein [Acholeplasmataceae bacterium]|nr:alpha/beta hydrolase-fold protein [Acholeplasmataceae bacterium]
MKTIKLELLPIITSKEARCIRILLPKGYENSNQKYPVLYMHDGQNLFEDETAYGNHSWGIDETLKDLNLDSVIVVGIDNSDLRLFEYSPWKSVPEVRKITAIDTGGLGDVYSDFVVNHVKPLIDKKYRTIPDYRHTMIAGSSMGAYISAYIATKFPNVFSVVGIFSLASWFNEEDFIGFLNSCEIDRNQRYFISIGRRESSNEADKNFNQIYIKNSRNFKELLEKKQVQDICYIETDDVHNELAWRKMFREFILWINKKV